MTENGIRNALSLLKLNYRVQFTNDEFVAMVKLYDKEFSTFTDNEVLEVINRIIKSSTFFPKIADVMNELSKNYIANYNDFEVWDIVLSSARSNREMAYEEWKNLPKDIQESISVEMLREIAMADTSSNEFLRKEVINSYKNHQEKTKRLFISNSNNIQKLENDNPKYFIGDKKRDS